MSLPSLLAVTASAPLGAAAIPTPSARAGAGGGAAAAEQFEALLLGQLLKGLRKTVPVSDEASTAREIYHEMHDEMLATHLARHGGIGLAAMIRSYLDRVPAAGGTK